MSSSLPVEHLSPSSLNRHMRCPRQWQDYYLFGNKGVSGVNLVMGSAFHLAIQRLNQGQEVGNYWQETLDAEEGEIDWKRHTPESARETVVRMVYGYWNAVGKHNPDGGVAEQEHLFEVEGVDLPMKAIIDFNGGTLIDYKTTGWYAESMVKRNGINREWVVAQHIYQLAVPKPSEIHVITTGKTPVVYVPQSHSDPLFIGRANDKKTISMIQQEYKTMLNNMEDYGYDHPWPGNPVHEWAYKYCGVEDCCKL